MPQIHSRAKGTYIYDEQTWIYDEHGLLIILGPREVTYEDEDKKNSVHRRSVLWLRSEVDSEPEPPESGEDSGEGSPESI